MFLLSKIVMCNMKQVPKYFGVVVIIALLALVTVSGSMDDADAVKAKGKYTQKHGSHTKAKVCGDKLCSSGEHPDPVNVGRFH
jgi:carbonic anhydrase